MHLVAVRDAVDVASAIWRAERAVVPLKSMCSRK